MIPTTKVIIKARNTIKGRDVLTAKFLTAEYKSKIIKFKLDEDPLQRQIDFLTFIESLVMIFSQYKEIFVVLLYYPKIGAGDIKYYV